MLACLDVSTVVPDSGFNSSLGTLLFILEDYWKRWDRVGRDTSLAELQGLLRKATIGNEGCSTSCRCVRTALLFAWR